MKNIQPVYSSVEVLEFTRQMTQYIIDNNIDGDLIECGVAAGSQIAMMKRTLIENNTDRIIWAFDSFEGIPFATEQDFDQPGIGAKDETKLGLLESTGISSHSIETVIQNFERYELPLDNVNFVKGWFENTIQPTSMKIEKIALLRLDGDLYRSTLVCLKWLLNKVVKGGVVIIDDYQLVGCRKAVHKFVNPKKIKEIHGIAFYKT